MITIEQFLKNRDKEFKNDYTKLVQQNSLKTVECTNKLLLALSKELNIKSFICTSGWRPKTVNNKLTNSDPSSPHITGEGIDIADADNKIKTYIGKNPKLVFDCGFKSVEEFKYTKTWLHLQTRLPFKWQQGKVIWNCLLLNNEYVWQNNFSKEIRKVLII